MITRSLVLAELEYCYSNVSEFLGKSVESITDSELFIKFNEHCDLNSQEYEAGDVHTELSDTYFLIESPDGWQEVGDLFIKSPRPIYDISTVNKCNVKVSSDHLCETSEGWIRACDLTKESLVLTKKGFSKIQNIIILDEEEVYDWEVLHENHRYWAGDISSHNSGKTFLMMNAAREAQKMGYFPFYVDTEGALDTSDFEKFGIDLARMTYVRLGVVSEVKFFVNDLIKTAEENLGLKIIVIVDSISMLETDKEVSDLDKGKSANDMGLRAKELRSLFKSFTLELSNLKIPLLFTSHISASLDQYKPDGMNGGMGPLYSASTVLMLKKAPLRDEATNAKTGVICRATTDKNRLAKPDAIEMHISFLKGMNPFVGLHKIAFNFNNCGIGRGNKFTEKEYSKLKPAEQEQCTQFELNGEIFYFFPKETARNYISKHTGEAYPLRELFSDKVWTREALTELDNNVIKPLYRYSSAQEIIDDELNDFNQFDDDSAF